MAQFELNFDKLPDTATSGDLQPGRHKLTVKEAKVVTSTTGSLMLQCTHLVDDTKRQINFDNYVMVKNDGSVSDFGQAKLKHLLAAINVIPKGSLKLNMLPPLITGKSFFVELDYTDKEKKYLGIKGIDTFEPVGSVTPIQTTEPTIQDQLTVALDEEI